MFSKMGLKKYDRIIMQYYVITSKAQQLHTPIMLETFRHVEKYMTFIMVYNLLAFLGV